MTPFHRASAQRGLVEAANTHGGPGGANGSISNMADAPNAVASPVAFGDRGGPDCTYSCATMTMRRSVRSPFCTPCCVPRSTGDRASNFGRPLRAMGSTVGRRRARFTGARVLPHVRSHRERPRRRHAQALGGPQRLPVQCSGPFSRRPAVDGARRAEFIRRSGVGWEPHARSGG
jgi:hypothetical protein